MASRQSNKAGNTQPPQDESFALDDLYNAESLNPALDKLYAEMGMSEGGEAQVYVYKILADSGNEARVWKGSPDDYDLDSLAIRFGSGEYLVRLYIKGETGRFGIKGSKSFHMLLDAQQESMVQARNNPQGQQIAQQVITPQAIADAVASALRLALPQAPQVDPLQTMKGMADVMSKFIQPQQMPQQPQINPFEMLKTMVEIQRELAPREPIEGGSNANTNDVLLGLINRFAPMFMQGMQGMQTAQIQQPQQLNNVPQLEQPAQPVKPVQPATEETEVSLRLKMGLNFLCMQAEAGNDPITYADMAIDNVPADALNQICNNPQYLDFLAQFEPKVKTHAEWFAKLREEIIEGLKPEETPST